MILFLTAVHAKKVIDTSRLLLVVRRFL